MYARRQTRPKPRKSDLKSFAAPIAGWISNRSLAVPGQPGQPQGAAVLDNFIPRATSVQLRRGKVLYCTLGNGAQDALSLFSYKDGANKHLFGATPTTIYDITNIEFPYDGELVNEDGDLLGDENGNWFGWSSTEFSDVMGGFTGGNWIVVQFATTGGVYLVGVNGEDTGFLYDGTTFYPSVPGGVYTLAYDALVDDFTEGATLTGGTSGATATINRVIPDAGGVGVLWLTDLTGGPFQDNETITDDATGDATANGADVVAAPGITFTGGLTTADMSYVWVYKNRLWFAQKDSMNAWYLENVDAIGGGAVIFPLSGVFGRGGSLLFGQTWSLEGSLEGGMSEQNIFVSTEGEVAVYQGIYPGEADTWSKVGVYRIGKPLGNRGFIRGGGDIAVATSVGLVPLSKAISLDITSLNVATVSYNIADAWSDAVQLRGLDGWQGEVWPELKIAAFAPPTPDSFPVPVIFITNTETGAWARFTGWQALCFEVYEGRLYFGSPDGKVFIANASGQDDGAPYTGAVMPLFEDFGTPASAKIGKLARAVVRATTPVNDQLQWHSDFNLSLPAPPSSTVVGGAQSIWGAGVWGESIWGAETPQVISENWRSVSGLGYACSVSLQITSGAIAPIDAELIRIDTTFETAEIVT
jgi:hypothetical protein